MQDMLSTFQWRNPAPYTVSPQGIITIQSHPESDYFVSPVDNEAFMSAAFCYREIRGDFMIRAKVSHAFESTYDAGALLFLADDHHWAKLAFEYTDINTHSVVSVITNGVSDDANGVDIEGDAVWLQMARKGNVFAMHYSRDGSRFLMHRYFSLPCGAQGQLGIVAQSPLGQGGDIVFQELVLEERSLEDLREGM